MKWTLEQRQTAQNSHVRQDRLVLALSTQTVQATRYEPMRELPKAWVGFSCIGTVTFKSVDEARSFAESMGYDGILL